MKYYEEPSLEVITLTDTDVLTTSFGGDTPTADWNW